MCGRRIARLSATRAGSSERGRPSRLIGVQRRNHVVDAVANLARVRSRIVAAIEDRLEIDGDRAIARQEGNGNRRQAVEKLNRINEERFPIIETVDRYMIVECAAFADGSIEWNGRDVLASAKKVNLNQIRLARKKLLLFATYSSRPCSPGVLFERLRTSIEVTSRLPSSPRMSISTNGSRNSSWVTLTVTGRAIGMFAMAEARETSGRGEDMPDRAR